MSHPINNEIYDKILDDEGFVNDVWNKFDATTKVEILTKSGVDMLDEYGKVYGYAEEPDEDEVEGNEQDNKNQDSNLEIEQ